MSTVSCKNIFLALRQNQISRFLEFYCLISYFFSKYFEQICRYIELVIIWLNWIYHSFESKVQYVFCVFFGSKPFYMCCNFLIENFFILLIEWYHTAQKMKFSSKDFFSKYDQTRSFPRTIHLLKISLMENFIFCAELDLSRTLSKFSERNFWHTNLISRN